MAVMHEGMLNPAEYKFIKKCWGALPMTMEEIFCIKEVRNSAILLNCELLVFTALTNRRRQG
jgi:hypothetical protein